LTFMLSLNVQCYLVSPSHISLFFFCSVSTFICPHFLLLNFVLVAGSSFEGTKI
uniref:Uncharacterized protein n=1 Tax=Aegilops tauschii subsp. strangulata TaxID=200361 RepID=A0A453LG75_AEGTS